MPYLGRAKIISLCGIDPQALAKCPTKLLLDLPLFYELLLKPPPQTMDKFPQQPGTFSIRPFCTDVLIKWMFFIK